MNGSSCMILKLKMINKALKVRLNCDCTLVMTLYTCTTRLACQMSRVLITPLVLYKRLLLVLVLVLVLLLVLAYCTMHDTTTCWFVASSCDLQPTKK